MEKNLFKKAVVKSFAGTFVGGSIMGVGALICCAGGAIVSATVKGCLDMQ